MTVRAIAALLAVLAIAGFLLIALGGSTTLEAIGMAMLGLAGVLAVAGAFYVVGLSEDRDRARRPPTRSSD